MATVTVTTTELAGGSAGLAGVVVLLAAVLLWRHRGLRQRLSSVCARFGGALPFAAPSGLDALVDHLERAAERGAEAVLEAEARALRLGRALDALPEGVVLANEDGSVCFRNAAADALIGARHSDALALRALEELLEQAAAQGPCERTLELYGPPRRTVAIRAHPIDDGRRSLGVVAVVEDVSERRRLEAIRRDFVANVSHELKTPVGGLGLLAETLVSEPDPEVARRLAARIQHEAFRVSRIIEDLLDLSRIEAEEAPPREPVEVGLVMAEAAERARGAAETAGVTLELEEPNPPAVVLGDRRQLVTALSNLLDNAVKYSEPGSTVRVAAVRSESFVDLVVEDHGIGIPARDLERIFERFYRVDQGRSRRTGGTGLGLAIVRHVAHNHGGTVLVRSREGEGSTFTLRLPAALEPAPSATREGTGHLGAGPKDQARVPEHGA